MDYNKTCGDNSERMDNLGYLWSYPKNPDNLASFTGIRDYLVDKANQVEISNLHDEYVAIDLALKEMNLEGLL